MPIDLPPCQQPVITTEISVSCAAPPWRIFISPRALIRRGDAVAVTLTGPGFAVTLDGIAEATAAPGNRLIVSILRRKITTIVAADGSLTLPGYISAAPRR